MKHFFKMFIIHQTTAIIPTNLWLYHLNFSCFMKQYVNMFHETICQRVLLLTLNWSRKKYSLLLLLLLCCRDSVCVEFIRSLKGYSTSTSWLVLLARLRCLAFWDRIQQADLGIIRCDVVVLNTRRVSLFMFSLTGNLNIPSYIWKLLFFLKSCSLNQMAKLLLGMKVSWAEFAGGRREQNHKVFLFYSMVYLYRGFSSIAGGS